MIRDHRAWRRELQTLLLRAKAQAPYVGWMLVERIWMVMSGVFVGFWVVRSLGPEEFGQFSAANAVAAVLAGLSTMGLETVVIRRLTFDKSNTKAALVTAAGIRFLGSVIYTGACWLICEIAFPHSRDVAFMALVVSSATIFRVTDVVGLWLQANNEYGTAARTRIFIRIAGDMIRILFILKKMSAVWFAIAVLLESMVAGAAFMVAGRLLARMRGSFEMALARSMFADGRPVMLSAIIAALYARFDQLVLYSLGGAQANGFYAAAARVSEAFNVVLLSVGTVAAAHFGRLMSAPDASVNKELRAYYRSMTISGLLVSAGVSALAGPMVMLIYGPKFSPTIPILRIHAWTFALVCTSVALEPWFYHYQKLRYLVPKTLIALAFTVPVALLGTFFFGAEGTAFAVVCTYAVSAIASNALLPGVRDAFRFQVRAFRRQEGSLI